MSLTNSLKRLVGTCADEIMPINRTGTNAHGQHQTKMVFEAIGRNIKCTMWFAKAGALALLALAPAQLASAQSAFTQVQIFGTASLAAGQTMKLNVVNPGVWLPSRPMLSCQLQLVFVTPSGTALKSVNVTVAPGHSASAELNRDSEIASGDTSVPIRAMVRNLQIIIEPSGVVPADTMFCPIVPSVEIVDNVTNKTQLIVTDAKTFTTVPGVVTAGAQN